MRWAEEVAALRTLARGKDYDLIPSQNAELLRSDSRCWRAFTQASLFVRLLIALRGR